MVALLFAPMPWILRLFAFVHLGGIRTRHRERFPRSGPVILVANHPATWVDVLVLHVALGRKLHFLADEHLYRPRIRAGLLRIFGALPVVTLGEASAREARNEATFRRCRRILERGEVVAIFPEGVSATDRSLKRFHTGAARIARERLAAGRPVPVIPAGIHYDDRVAFRTRVVVDLGNAVRFPPVHGGDGDAPGEWIATATAQLEHAVAELILDLPEPGLRAMVEELLPVVSPPARDIEPLEQARELARWLDGRKRDHPELFAAIARHADRHRRIRTALGLTPRDAVSRARLGGLAFVTAVGAIPGITGMLLHAAPATLTQRIARRFDPTRVTLMRIGVGWVSFTLWYAAIAAATSRALGPRAGLAALLATAVLGGCALLWFDARRELRARLRWRLAARRQPRRMSHLRREQETLVRLLGDADARRRARETLEASP